MECLLYHRRNLVLGLTCGISIRQLTNLLHGLEEKRDKSSQRFKGNAEDMIKLTGLLGKSFPHQERLESLLKRQAEIEEMLRPDPQEELEQDSSTDHERLEEPISETSHLQHGKPLVPA
jgi:predicted nuclease with TOPRIM domain